MKILFLTTDDILRNASSNIRNVSLINGLIKLKHDVTIVSLCHGHAADNGLEKAIAGSRLIVLGGTARSKSIQKDNGAIIGAIKKLVLMIYDRFRIFDPYIYKIPDELDFVQNSTYDLVISSSDPRSSHIFADRIIHKYMPQTPWVQYWGDPMANDISSSKWMRKRIEKAENNILEKCDLIVYTNNITGEYISKKYRISPLKITSIPTSFAICPSRVNKEKRKKTSINVGYFGAYFKKSRNMQPLVEAILKLKGYTLTLVGNNDYDEIKDDRIKRYPQMSASDLHIIQDEMDILIVVENKPNEGVECVQIPGKLFHYGLSKQKILVISENGIIENEFKDYDRYEFCKNTTEEIESSLLSLAKSSDKKMCSPVEAFFPENVAKKLLDKIMPLLNK